ncbi:hypothetical protein G6L94_31020 [Agrobacterium rhizogenes]|uniref:hypothetical protein n=1 Tax=Rhizobium rhizogenes TaxID=359 RepID=UPI0008100A03|nr:hypothetical protein [Rhizobium rhizogenes]OCJ17151.1 hypothetical protein A6U88_33600 [Agrobacterium sp. B131/95]OCJ27347.1 hypothetical protein A6U89_29715 [Agrobacterium sp. B133/95]NTI46631.1 hypothetical protein [Rhizobium rhizogenes]NTI52761.1 hypothetical protein [Rhizobium rhizogenes]NTI98134.1 hypothetical protein [Rhizobium rhizogenes]
MSIVEYPFPGSTHMEELHYCVFPDKLENDERVLFHGTLADDFEKIKRDGFKSAVQLGNARGLGSVSYAKQSSAALSHIRNRHPNDKVIIIAVQFDSATTRRGMVANASDIHVYDGTQPNIVGFCKVPSEYQFF